jgi:chaperonin GroEL
VALYDGHLKDASAMNPLLQLAAEQEPPRLLFVAHEMSSEVVNLLASVHQHPKNKLQIAAFSVKMGGATGQLELDDLALLTGATLQGDTVGRPLEKITLADLGKARRVEAGKEELLVVQGGGDSRAIREEIVALQTRLEAAEPGGEEQESLQKRLARLSGSAGVLKIGALTKAARQVLRQKAEQGLKAAAATLEEGVLPGGGIAFVLAAREIDPDSASNEDERMGMIATRKALEAPFFRIFHNAQKPAAAVALHNLLAAGEGHVYDVLRDEVLPAREAGLLDAAKVARRALETAASGAEMALSVDVTVLKKRPVTNVDYEP